MDGMVGPGVDNVNMSSYIDVDNGNIESPGRNGHDAPEDTRDPALAERRPPDGRRPADGRRPRGLPGRDVAGSPHHRRRSGLVETGEIRRVDRRLLADARVGVRLPARLGADTPNGRPNDRRGARPRGGHHRRAGVARHDESLQRRHAARHRPLFHHGPGHRAADARERGRGRRVVATGVRRPRASDGPSGSACRSRSSAPRRAA